MKKIVMILLCILCFGVQGCANYLYQGKISAVDSAGQEREFLLYWPKTKALFGPAKAGPAGLLTECGSTILFVQQPKGIVFRGDPGLDKRFGGQDESLATDMICGEFVDVNRFVEIGEGELLVSIFCEPKPNDFAVQKRTYLQARPEAYRFPVTSRKQWSLFGKTPQAPGPLPCRVP